MLSKCCFRSNSNPLTSVLQHHFPTEFLAHFSQAVCAAFPPKRVAVNNIRLFLVGWQHLWKLTFGHSDLKTLRAERLCLLKWLGLSQFFRKLHLSIVVWIAKGHKASYRDWAVGTRSGEVVESQEVTEAGWVCSGRWGLVIETQSPW